VGAYEDAFEIIEKDDVFTDGEGEFVGEKGDFICLTIYSYLARSSRDSLSSKFTIYSSFSFATETRKESTSGHHSPPHSPSPSRAPCRICDTYATC
jgi:hypothetical protein